MEKVMKVMEFQKLKRVRTQLSLVLRSKIPGLTLSYTNVERKGNPFVGILQLFS